MVSAYANICIGSAKLKPIPEGYEPKEEEYERHPISRQKIKRNMLSDKNILTLLYPYDSITFFKLN